MGGIAVTCVFGGMMGGRIASVLACGSCAVFWIVVAFLVGFPQEVFSLRFAPLAAEFVHNPRHEAMFIPILLTADILIGLLLDHVHMNRTQGLVLLLAGFVYLLVIGLAPEYGEDHTALQQDTGNHLLWFSVALVSLVVVRFISFLPKPLTPIHKFTAGPEGQVGMLVGRKGRRP